jgi:hypothetical protein
MQIVQAVRVRKRKCTLGNRLVTAFESTLVYKGVRNLHNILIHPVLMCKFDHSVWMSVGQPAEERNIESALLCTSALDKGWELEVVADQDEFIGKAQWSKTCWKCNLRSFVNNTNIEGTTTEQSTVKGGH